MRSARGAEKAAGFFQRGRLHDQAVCSPVGRAGWYARGHSDMTSSTIRSAAPAFLLSLVLLAPFFGKAFTIDDTVFMREARHALQDPLHPTAFDMVWGEVPERVSQIVPTGPVMAWLLVPSALAGGVEWLAHLVQLAMLWLAILATVSLALRLGLAATWATAAGLLLVAMPAVLAMAGTAMPDVPAMALGVAGIERLVAWSQDRRFLQGVLAACFLALGALTRSHVFLLLGVGAVFLVGPLLATKSWRDRLVLCAPLLAAPVVVALVTLMTSDPQHGAGSILDAAARYSSASTPRLASNTVALPIHWVLAMAFGVPWLALRGRTMVRTRSVLLAALAGTLLSAMALSHAGRSMVPLAAVAGLGIATLWDAISDGWRRKDWVQVAFGMWLLIALCAVPYVNLPAKLLVASAPAAALLVARELAGQRRRTAWIVLGTTLGLGAGLGVAILRADAALGDLGRRAAAELIAPRVAAGQRVWFVGHWGFQWYAENAGAQHATLTAPYPVPGDLLVVSLGSARSDAVLDAIASRNPAMRQVGLLQDIRPGGRVMNKKLGVGFYSNVSGYLPWSWGESPVDVFLSFDL